MAQVINTTNASNLTLRSSSAMGMIEGNGDTNSLITVNSFSNSKVVSTETSILTLRNNQDLPTYCKLLVFWCSSSGD